MLDRLGSPLIDLLLVYALSVVKLCHTETYNIAFLCFLKDKSVEL